MKRKILITGATGFIGNQVIKNLLDRCDNNTILIATSHNEEIARTMSWYNDIKYISCDIHQPDNFYNILQKPDIVIHLAWKDHHKNRELFHLEENMMLQYNFIKSFITNGCKRLVIAGTSAEYGKINGPLSENMPSEPVTSYAIAKDSLRKMLELLLAEHKDVSFYWMRLFNFYGKGQNPNTFLGQLESAIENYDNVFNMTGGEQLRDFISVKDGADKIVSLSLNNNPNGIYNICSGKPTSLRNIAEDFILKKNSDIQLNLGHFPYTDYEPMACWGIEKKYQDQL